jgi:hypothetical protein
MTPQLPFTFFDCDNHYYQALDAFTRHIDPQYKKRAIQWAQLDGRQRLLVGGRVGDLEPIPAAYRDRDARVALNGFFLRFPNLGIASIESDRTGCFTCSKS